MSHAYKSDQTADGDIWGPYDLEAIEVYVSTINRVGDDPVEPVRRLIPEGTPHPNSTKYPELRVERFVQHRTPNPLTWFVDVIYGFPDRAGFAGWRIQTTHGEELRRVYTDLDDQIVGSHAYTVAEEASQTPFFTRTVKGRVKLGRPEGNVRRREGMDVYRTATGILMTRTLQAMTDKRMRGMDYYTGRCNSKPFLAWGPGELLLRQVIISEEYGQSGSSRRTVNEGFVYPVELHFSVRLASDDEPEGWRLLRKIDTFTDNEGNVSVILENTTDGGNPNEIPVQTVYRRYETRNFHDVLVILEGGTPRSGLP